MSLKNDVLTYLRSNPNIYVSGEDLAGKFNKSRGAVWKAIKLLQKEGYKINAVTNRGYSFDDNSDVLNAEELEKGLNFDCKVKFYDVIDSTNTQAKRLINDGENQVMLVVADEQTAGRGRQGKSFYSPAKTGVYMTLVIHPMVELQNAVTATTAAAVSVCKAIEKLTDAKPEIKWVNDVFINGQKICGILTEAVTDFETQTVTSVVIGIGINISTVDFPSDVENATALNKQVKRAQLISTIANELNSIAVGSFDEFIDYYRKHSLIVGEEINFTFEGETKPAKAVEIDNLGGLVIELPDGTKTTLRSGEITIRKR